MLSLEKHIKFIEEEKDAIQEKLNALDVTYKEQKSALKKEMKNCQKLLSTMNLMQPENVVETTTEITAEDVMGEQNEQSDISV